MVQFSRTFVFFRSIASLSYSLDFPRRSRLLRSILSIPFLTLHVNRANLSFIGILEIHAPFDIGPALLPRTSHPAPRSEAAKPAHRAGPARAARCAGKLRGAEARGFWPRKGVWAADANVYTRGKRVSELFLSRRGVRLIGLRPASFYTIFGPRCSWLG